ncbi:phage tail protein [Corallococcus sp. AS-1-6]|uniref:phage tail protein n=1 Tax=Corallococcus sp. AS-1-6 TaxID=2874599 RepID=UPI001CBFF99F|nr:phage tail protein [Corallococcus sp. AS-1-6]MBZ4371484.1 phage tail protein [Corallococcus sp. AS-1-6]
MTDPTAIDPDDNEDFGPPMTVPGSLKHRLLAKNRKVLKTLDIEGDKVHLIKPTQGDRVKVLEAAKAAGEMGEDDKPTTPRNALRTVARLAACLLYDPTNGTPIYTVADLDALVEAVWLEDIQEDLQAAFAPSMKDVRGKSAATPS